MPAWNSYSLKTTPADTDTVMIKDNEASGNPNKRVQFSNLWDWIMLKKYSFSTGASTIAGAITSLKNALDTAGQTISTMQNNITNLNTKTGTLSNLDTTTKTDLVGAINETLSSAGAKVTVSGTTLTIT